MTELRRHVWKRTTGSLRRQKRLAMVFLVAATLPWAVPSAWAASNAAAEAVCDERAGLLALALGEISAALQLEPGQPDAQNTLAVVYAEMGNRECARAVWTKLVRIDPDYQPARKNLAVVEQAFAEGASTPRLSRIAESSQSFR